MAATAEKTDPVLWDHVKDEVTVSDKGGRRGQWSARKAQLAVQAYKREGGGYRGKKDPHNHLVEWQHEEWGTKSGGKSTETGERYLPKKAREKLSDGEYARTTAKKRADTRRGKQFSAQPDDIARKVAPTRAGGEGAARRKPTAPTRAELLQRARALEIPGRSAMRKADLLRALSRAEARAKRPRARVR